MTRKNIIILGLVAIVIIIGVVAFFPKKPNTQKIVDTRISIPGQVKTDYSSDTGAKTISLTKQQYDEVYLIKTLRNSMPINRDNFIMDFDYGINKFVVKYKDINKGTVEFEKWLSDTGYSAISKQYFQTK